MSQKWRADWWVPGNREKWLEGGITEGHKESFESNEYVYYGDGFTVIYII